jgi:predicted secreted protein
MASKQEVRLKLLEVVEIALEKRGAMGLELHYRIADPSILEVSELPVDSTTQHKQEIGGGLKVFYQIRAIQKGVTKIIFFETRSWDKNFKEVIQKEVDVEIVE